MGRSSLQSLELARDQLRGGLLPAAAPFAPGVDGVPAPQPLEAQRSADDLLGISGLGVHVAEARERRPRDRAVAQEAGLALAECQFGARVGGAAVRAADLVRAG